MQAHLSIPLANYPANVDKEANLYIHTNIAQLVNQAVSMVTVDQNDPHFFHHLYANLIFNYLGKWCQGENGNPVPINVALLETGVFNRFGERHFCPIYPDEVLSTKFTHILQQERACLRITKSIRKDINYNLNQMKDPETKRPIWPLGRGNRWEKLNPRTGFWYTRTPKATERNTAKPGTLHTKKQSAILLPTNLNYMNLFNNSSGIGFLFDFAELYHKKEKYCFENNALTNGQWWYRGQHEFFNPRSVGVDAIRAKNRRAVASGKKIDWNELRIGLPKRCLRGMVALTDTFNGRRQALEAMYYAARHFELDYDLPVWVSDPSEANGLRYYSHKQRLEDVLLLSDNPEFFKDVVKTSVERLTPDEKQEMIEKLRTHSLITEELTVFLNSKKEHNSLIDLTVQPCVVKFKETTYQVTRETVLSGLALITVFPLAGVGFYQMIRDAINTIDAIEKVVMGVGITLATLTVLPLVIYGGRHAIATLVNSVSYEDPNEQQIEVDNNVPILMKTPTNNGLR